MAEEENTGLTMRQSFGRGLTEMKLTDAQAATTSHAVIAVRDVAELPDRDSPEDQPEMMLVNRDELLEIVGRSIRAALADPRLVPQWMPIASAPKSTADGNYVSGIYILGYCPEPDACNLSSCICVVWWEPLMKKGKGMWYGEGGYEVRPTHWQPLPQPPKD